MPSSELITQHKKIFTSEDGLRMGKIVEEILQEREYQMVKWGEQNHTPLPWLAILMEEVGEASQEALRINFGGKNTADYRAEIIQVAAVALAMIECLDRNNAKV